VRGRRWNRAAQCDGKVAFASPIEAHRVAMRRAKRSGRLHDDARFRRAYRCPHCGMWHLGGEFKG
jgi:hypothetical protein